MTFRTSTVRLSVADAFSANLGKFENGMQRSVDATKQFDKEAKQASQTSRQLTDSLGQIAGGLGLAMGIAGVTAAVAGLGKESVDLAMKMEQNKIAFTTMTGSAAEAQKHLEELRDFAAKTPFQFTDLIDASRRMHAFGFETSQIIPMLTDIGDAAAAMGASADTVNRITLAIGQMSAKGKVSAQEMLQLTEAGIPAWRYLAESMGVSTAEIQKMTEQGLVPADDAIQALLAGMREDFGGQMAKQAETAAGAVSNLTDKWEQLLTVWGTGALPAQKGLIGVLDQLVANQLEYADALTAIEEANKRGIITQDEYNKLQARTWLDQGTVIERGKELAGVIEDQNSVMVITDDILKRTSSQGWEQYSRSVAKAGESTEKTSKEIEKAAEALEKQKLATVKLVTSGRLDSILESSSAKAAKFQETIADLRQELNRLTKEHGQATHSADDLQGMHLDVQSAQIAEAESAHDLWEAENKLKDNMDPAKQEELARAYEKARIEHERDVLRLRELTGEYEKAKTETVDNSEAIRDVNEKLAETEKQQHDAAEAAKKATDQYAFQTAAAYLDADGQLALAQQMGLVDEKALLVEDSAKKVTQAFNDGAITAEYYAKVMSGLIENTKTYKDMVDDLQAFTDAGGAVEGMGIPHRQHGGGIRPGQSAWVGEGGPELVTGGRDGAYVTPTSQTNHNEKTLSVTQIINNPMDAAHAGAAIRQWLRG